MPRNFFFFAPGPGSRQSRTLDLVMIVGLRLLLIGKNI